MLCCHMWQYSTYVQCYLKLYFRNIMQWIYPKCFWNIFDYIVSSYIGLKIWLMHIDMTFNIFIYRLSTPSLLPNMKRCCVIMAFCWWCCFSYVVFQWFVWEKELIIALRFQPILNPTPVLFSHSPDIKSHMCIYKQSKHIMLFPVYWGRGRGEHCGPNAH